MPSESTATPDLPDTVEELRSMLLATLAERDELLARTERLQHLLLKLNRLQFGGKSERLPEQQMQLGLEDIEQALAKDEAEEGKRDPALAKDRAARRRANRGALPAHLPRIEITLAPEDTTCPCCRATRSVIGEDTSERLDVIPAQYRVLVTRRPKLACQS
jgi:transposase